MAHHSIRRRNETKMAIITINGEKYDIAEPINLQSYLDSLGINMSLVAVAYNGTVISRREIATVTLSNGDHVEIVQAVGGG